jgi:hypothetical protein
MFDINDLILQLHHNTDKPHEPSENVQQKNLFALSVIISDLLTAHSWTCGNPCMELRLVVSKNLEDTDFHSLLNGVRFADHFGCVRSGELALGTPLAFSKYIYISFRID